MKASELRIGNLVSYRSNTVVIDTLSSSDQCIIIDRYFKYAEQHLTNIKPIPLTEEWLVKFGFNNLNLNCSNYMFELIHNDMIGYRFSIEGQYGYPEIKYVHQLQNLYFALTGEELTIK